MLDARMNAVAKTSIIVYKRCVGKDCMLRVNQTITVMDMSEKMKLWLNFRYSLKKFL